MEGKRGEAAKVSHRASLVANRQVASGGKETAKKKDSGRYGSDH
jgi:hypothetical protein